MRAREIPAKVTDGILQSMLVLDPFQRKALQCVAHTQRNDKVKQTANPELTHFPLACRVAVHRLAGEGMELRCYQQMCYARHEVELRKKAETTAQHKERKQGTAAGWCPRPCASA